MRKTETSTAATVSARSHTRVRCGRGSMTGSSGGATGAASRMLSLSRRWPALVAVILAWPVGALAADPVVNGADLAISGVCVMFVIGVCR